MSTRLATRVAAPVMEVFASIQGEGPWVGEPQAFVRVRGCPMRCRWCDTPGSWAVAANDRARVALPGGARHEPSWATPFQVACWIAAVEPGRPRTVSVTGGEPLLWPDFVLGLADVIGSRRLHLETAGGHPDALARVIDACDHVSLDLKPDFDLDPPQELDPSVVDGALVSREPAPRSPAEWSAARSRSLTLVRGRDAVGKLVVSGGRAAADYLPILEEVAAHAPGLGLVVQPVTPVAGVRAADLDVVIEVAESARELDLSVRVLPQVHRVLALP